MYSFWSRRVLVSIAVGLACWACTAPEDPSAAPDPFPGRGPPATSQDTDAHDRTVSRDVATCKRKEPRTQCEKGYCLIEPGCFTMGVPRDVFGAGHSNQQIQVTLTLPFTIGQTEVTNAQWRSVGFDLPRHRRAGDEGTCLADDCPVGNITFFDALVYVNRLSEREELAPCYTLSGCRGDVGNRYECDVVEINAGSVYHCEGYRLPTEAEWEYAARAGTATAFYTGDMRRESLGCYEEPALEPIAWYCNNSGGQAHPVGRKQPNDWGLHDMLGNAFEYCNDLFDRRGYGQGPLTDPSGTLTPGKSLTPAFPHDPAQTRIRVVRGGSMRSAPAVTTAGARHFGAPAGTDSGAGFRVARTML